jgi:type IV pilus assembly protein PilN
VIKINLLKSFSSGGSESFVSLGSTSDRDQLLIDTMKRLAIVLIGPIALYAYEYQAIPKLQQELTVLQNELAETTAFNQSKSGLAAEIKKYEEEQTKINAQMNFISKIARDKINEFKLFQHLQLATPESVWINKLEFRDNELSLNAESDVPEDLNKFSVRLSNAEFLTNIVPIYQDIKTDPFRVKVSTTLQTLTAQFNSEAAGQ